jgi:hypothetical protein
MRSVNDSAVVGALPWKNATYRRTSRSRGLLFYRLLLGRYRFGTRSSDFLICGNCGVYVAALLTSSNGQFATLNINTIRAPLDVPETVPVSYEGESGDQRQSRREQRWTPVAEAV